MRALLDTNIIIHRENVIPTNSTIGQLFYWLDKLHYEKVIHPLSVKELRCKIYTMSNYRHIRQ